MSTIITLSFYRYAKIENPNVLRAQLHEQWFCLGVRGRTYVSREGINAQISVPEEHLDEFKALVRNEFPGIPFKQALEEKGESFKKLHIKVRDKIVADGLDDGSYDVTNVGTHLTAKEFNEAMESEHTVVVDMRNHYECEVGYFDGAYLPAANTFREALPEVKSYLEDKKDKKILLYCTGGIRCEKASAWLKHEGFNDVNQLHGGIISYAHQVKRDELQSHYKGVNFVFDKRVGERVTDDVLSECHQCGAADDTHTNCINPACNLLFIQCKSCQDDYEGCCSLQCRDMLQLPKEQQVQIQNELEKTYPKFLRSRMKVDLKKLRAMYTADTASQDQKRPLPGPMLLI
jgi:UPF0176 protein